MCVRGPLETIEMLTARQAAAKQDSQGKHSAVGAMQARLLAETHLFSLV